MVYDADDQSGLFFLYYIEKGPAADVTDAPQPEGLLCNPCERSDIDKALLNCNSEVTVYQ